MNVASAARAWQAPPPLLGELDEIRFRSRVTIEPSGCHQWQGPLDGGYGRFGCKGRNLLTHRVSWWLAYGDIPKGLQIDHLCRNRGCVNVLHLETVTIATNVLRGAGITAVNLAKTHCCHGHKFSPENTYITPRGARTCRTCAVSRTRVWRSQNLGA